MPNETGSHFASGFKDGVSGTFQSLRNSLQPSNYSHAARQTSQFFSAVGNPRRTGNSLHTAGQEMRPHLDVRNTLARTGGDMLGSAATLLGATALTVAAFRQPYLRSRFGTQVAQHYDRSPFLQSGFFRHQRVRNFIQTRPLAFGVGSVLGVASFIGGAGDRAQTATENQTTWPHAHTALSNGGVHELTATQVDRAVRRT